MLDFDLGRVREEFLDAVERAGYPRAEVERLTVAALRADSATAAKRSEEATELERRWYRSLEAGSPDYAVYDTLGYLGETFACWQIYSRKYIAGCRKRGVFAIAPKLVVDVGCGVGITTASFARLFPGAEVVGTNLPGTTQWRVAEELARGYGFTLAAEIPDRPADLVFASEFFEHLPAPLDYLELVLNRARPRLFVFANTFGSPAIGHFRRYQASGGECEGGYISRAFGARLRAYGYEKRPIRFWNDRPQIWAAAGGPDRLFV